MEIKDTVTQMLSDNYKDRLSAEYNQLCIRIEKIENEIYGYCCSVGSYHKRILLRQLEAMYAYRDILAFRILDSQNENMTIFKSL